MVKRSLQACPAKVHQAKRAFTLKGWTQENLAGEVNLKTRQPIWRFFTGQPVERQVFVEICGILDLDWREIALDPPAAFPEVGIVPAAATLDLDGLVAHLRAQRSEFIQHQCGIVQLLDVGRPVAIDDIYVDIHLWEQPSSDRWHDFTERSHLTPECWRQSSERTVQNYISGNTAVENYSKLKVLGKLGAGKTLLLKHLAIECDRGNFAADRVPILMSLSDFAQELSQHPKFSLLEYIAQSFSSSGSIDISVVETLLRMGRALILIDDIDDVNTGDSSSVLKKLRKFSEKYHKNQFIVTCRNTTITFQLHGFTAVEIAPFTHSQIVTYVHKWLALFDRDAGRKQSQLLQNLELPENWRLRQLAATPLLLHLVCNLFQCQDRSPARWLEFSDRTIGLLLGRWDEAKGRDRVSERLSLSHKLQLLSQLAATTFDRGRYDIDRRTIEWAIGDYLRQLQQREMPPAELRLESAAVLAELEHQHGVLVARAQGIYSFSTVLFQEYFTACNISLADNLTIDSSLQSLVNHLTDPRWRQVFLLTAVMLGNADKLVRMMRQQIDILVDREPVLQDFLMWASQTLPRNRDRLQQLTAVIADYRHTHSTWQLHRDWEQLLQSYCYINQLLLDCLSSAVVSPQLRQQIESNFISPDPNIPLIPTLLPPAARSPQSA